MPPPSDEVKRIHNTLLVRLDKTFDSESDTFRGLKRVARTHLYAGQVDRCKSMHDLLESLQGKGVIKIGEYSKLKLMLKDADCEGNEALEMIEEAEEDIRILGLDSETKKRRENQKEDLHGSDTTDSPTTEKYKVCPPPTQDPEMFQKTSYTKGKGFCLIINFFSKGREGSQQDETRLKSFLESVNCEVSVQRDLDQKQAVVCLEDCQRVLNTRIPQAYAYFICVIMSHGDQDGIKTMDDKRITMEEVMTKFTNDQLQDFVGKPKIFLVQACRGANNQSGYAVADDEVADLVEEVMKLPKDADMLLAHATTPGYKAWRRVQEGSWFFQCLLDLLERYHNTEHLEDILISLRGVIATQHETADGVKQMPCTYSTLTKRFYI
ncbi:caspase-3-like isoform X2 [Liolophura sinensis]